MDFWWAMGHGPALCFHSHLSLDKQRGDVIICWERSNHIQGLPPLCDGQAAIFDDRCQQWAQVDYVIKESWTISSMMQSSLWKTIWIGL
jgi:hypothetical protein